MVLIHIPLLAWIAGWHLLFEAGHLSGCINDVPECFPEKPWAHIHVSYRTSFSSGVTKADISPSTLCSEALPAHPLASLDCFLPHARKVPVLLERKKYDLPWAVADGGTEDSARSVPNMG